MLGPLFMLLGTALFGVLDASAKFLIGQHALASLLLVRGLVGLAVVGVAVLAGARAGTARPQAQALRAVTTLISASTFTLAFRELPLAEAYLVFFTAPFATMALSRLLLAERVAPAAWGWAAFGFAGILVALAPRLGEGGGLLGYALAFVGTLAYAFTLVTTRRLAGSETMAALMLWPSAGAVLASLPFALEGWGSVPRFDLGLMVLNGGLWCGATALIALSVRVATPTRVAPFEFSGLVWSTLLDRVVFGLSPSLGVLLGAVTIVIACVMGERAAARRGSVLPVGPGGLG